MGLSILNWCSRVSFPVDWIVYLRMTSSKNFDEMLYSLYNLSGISNTVETLRLSNSHVERSLNNFIGPGVHVSILKLSAMNDSGASCPIALRKESG